MDAIPRGVDEGDGEWRVVRTRKAKPGRPRSVAASSCCADHHAASALRDAEDEETLRQKLQRSKARVQQSAFYSALTAQMRRLRILESLLENKSYDQAVMHEFLASLADEDSDSSSSVDLVVLGVGSLRDSEVARSQMSLALLLKEDFSFSSVSVYDPVLSPMEREFLRSLGCVPMEREALASHAPTLFYMPHCGASLYNRLLQENSEPWRLAWLCILGNSFRRYQESWSMNLKPKHARPEYLLAMQKFVAEHAVDAAGFPCLSAFNDMSWHLFPVKSVFPANGEEVRD